MRSTISALLRATHLAPSLAVTAMAGLLAVSAGRGAGAWLVAAAVLAGQFSIGWANDWIDRGRDTAAGRVDKPIVRGQVSATTVGWCAAGALALCVPASLASGTAGGSVHLLAVAWGWSYDLGLKRTVVSVLPYAMAFGLLPSFITLGLPDGSFAPWWATTAGALLGAGAHFTNALPDLADDARTGVRGLPQRVGARACLAAAAVLLTLGAGVVALGPDRSALSAGAALVAAGLLVAGVLAAGVRGQVRLAFRLTMAVAVVAVLAFVTSGSALA